MTKNHLVSQERPDFASQTEEKQFGGNQFYREGAGTYSQDESRLYIASVSVLAKMSGIGANMRTQMNPYVEWSTRNCCGGFKDTNKKKKEVSSTLEQRRGRHGHQMQ